MMILFFSLLITFNAKAQQGPILTVNCNQLKVVIVPKPYTGTNDQANCTGCCNNKYSCKQIEYDVFLQAVPGPNLPTQGNFILSYTELYIVLNLNRFGAQASSINEAATESCLATYLTYPVPISDASFEANSGSDEVTLHITDELDATPFIPFTNFMSSSYLFSIVVDAFPGETFGIGCADFTYASAANCENQTCTPTPLASFPLPSTVNTDLTLSLGNINCNPEEYIDLPILVSSSLSGIIEFFDFAVVIDNTAFDGFNAAPEILSVLGLPQVTIVDREDIDGSYIVKFSYTAQSAALFSGTDVQIAIIRIYRPPILTQAYNIDAALLAGRIITNSGGGSGTDFVCRALQLGSNTSEQCAVTVLAACPKINFTISKETINLNDCSTLKMYAALSWNPADFGNATSLNFNQIRAILDFGMDAGVTISSVALEGFSCPSSGNDPVGCPGNCIQYSGNTVELCINVVSAITIQNNARIVVTFNAPTGCVRGAVIRKILLDLENASPCQPDLIVGGSVFPYCSPMMVDFIEGNIADELHCWIDEVVVFIKANQGSGCDKTFLTGSGVDPSDPDKWCKPYTSGCLCSIATVESYNVKPEKDDNPLNGVTTYDLVLISKHILGIEPLASPYKMIAADANKSNSITTFDIVELRKLILGIQSNLPGNKSWRFVDKAFVFPNANNPFHTAFPETKTVSSLPDVNVNFRGVKIGDVNNTSVVSCSTNCTAPRHLPGRYVLTTPRRSDLKSGDIYTLPIRAGGEAPLMAWQSAFRFDPNLLELIGPSLGDAQGLSTDNFNLAQASEGIIRAAWFAQPDALEEETLMPGQSLFNLTFRVKQSLPESTSLLSIDESLMPNMGWTPEGAEYKLETSVSSSREGAEQLDMPAWVRCWPNPSLGEVVFDVMALPQPRHAQLTVFDAFGHRVWWQDLGKETGPVQINVPEAANWPAGVYHWELRFDKQKSVGTFVRL